MQTTRSRAGGRSAPRRRRSLVLLVVGLALGCSDPASFEEGPLHVRTVGSAFLLENTGLGAVSYVAIEERTSHVIDLAPCEDWPILWPRETRLLPFDQVTGYRKDSRAVFYWCLLDVEGRAYDGGQFVLPM